jgi:hypothetical protein
MAAVQMPRRFAGTIEKLLLAAGGVKAVPKAPTGME